MIGSARPGGFGDPVAQLWRVYVFMADIDSWLNYSKAVINLGSREIWGNHMVVLYSYELEVSFW